MRQNREIRLLFKACILAQKRIRGWQDDVGWQLTLGLHCGLVSHHRGHQRIPSALWRSCRKIPCNHKCPRMHIHKEKNGSSPTSCHLSTAEDKSYVTSNVNLELCEGREVRRMESVEGARVHLGRSVSAHQLVVEVNCHLEKNETHMIYCW